MPTKYDEAFAKVQKLAAIFESGKDRYLSSDLTNNLFGEILNDGRLDAYPATKNLADKSWHDRLAELVEQMLAAKSKLPSTKTEGEGDRLENKCATLDQQIDALVYELYGLTAEEIKLVEGAK